MTVSVSAEPDTSVLDLIAALRPFQPADGALRLEGTPLDRWATVGQLELSDGQAISVGEPLEARYDRADHSGADVMVTGGPDAGKVVKLAPGSHLIGRERTRSVALPDPEVSRSHAQLDGAPDGAVVLSDAGSVNQTLVDGTPLTEPRRLSDGETIRLGRTALSISRPEPADTALVRARDGTVTYNRRFRSAPEQYAEKVDFPEEYEEDPKPTLNWIMMVVPMVAGIAMVTILKNPMYLMFAFLGPVSGLGNWLASRRTHKARQAAKLAKHEHRLESALAALHEAASAEVRVRRSGHPDPATLVRAARGPRRRLWERRPSDPDFLELRVGLADLPSTIEVRGGTAPAPPLLSDVPVTVPLLEAGSVGIAGPIEQSTGIARTLLFQVAALHSPSDVRIVVVSAEPVWSWATWLPHVRTDEEGGPLQIGSDPASTRARLDELDQLLAARKTATNAYGGRSDVLPRIVVLFDRPSRLDRARVHKILGEGPELGIHAICIEESEPELPEEHAGASIAPFSDRMAVRVRNRPTITEVRDEIIDLTHLDVAARCLAPLRPESTASAELPGSIRFLEMIGLTDPTPAAVRSGWSSRAGRCRAAVGMGPGGALEIELDDRAPHALVAGTSGAGKSEFLKTFLAGLALTNHPDDLQFLLVDFKGGGDFRTLARLPHTIDLVTNTDDADQSAVKRALELLEAEVERRQRLVNEHGGRDLATYRTLRQRDGSLPVMGRLLVVADEFAELASRQPELLDKLVSVARVGRAMGVHLILATQRPSGAVTPQIQANVPLRVCFRVLEGQGDEVIGARDPERISRNSAGRGYVRYGDEALTEVQCARVANARPDVAAERAPISIEVETWATVGHPQAAAARGPEVPDADTDLWTLVEAIIAAAGEDGWRENPVPWPKPLPSSVPFIPGRSAVVDELGQSGAVIGMVDDPRSQRHVPHVLGLGAGNLAVAGSPGSGRTTTLRTAAAALSYAVPPTLLHMHAIDMAGGGLRSLRPFPHLGTITDDPGLAARLLDRLEEEVEDRRSAFSTGGWSNLSEQWASVVPADRLPYVLILVDGWDSLAQLPSSSRGPSLAERFVRLLGDGSSVGIQAVVAGDRSTAAGQVGRQMTHRLVLRLNDATDYGYLDIHPRSIPRSQASGRALIPGPGGTAAEVQVAHVGRDAAGPTQVAALRLAGEHLSSLSLPAEDLPWRLAPLPARVSLADALTDRHDRPKEAKIPIPVGVGGDEARTVWTDLADHRSGLMVAGPPGSGRSTTLLSIARAVLDSGSEVAIAHTKPSPLAELSGAPGVRAVVDLSVAGTEGLAALTVSPVVLLIDDADLLDRRDDDMIELANEAPARQVHLVIAGATDTLRDIVGGWFSTVRSGRTGLIITPRSSFDANAIGLSDSLSSEHQFTRPTGRALWATGGRLTIVQVPHV